MDNGHQNHRNSGTHNTTDPRSPPGFFQSPSPHAYTQPQPQPVSIPSQQDNRFHLYSPSPVYAGIRAPDRRTNNDNSVQPFTFAALNHHLESPAALPTPQLQIPLTPGPLASTLIRVASTHTEESSQPKPTQTQSKEKPAASKKGKGARSGKNARSGGHSDTEINALDEKTKKAADIVPPARWDDASTLKLIEFITAPERWDKVTTSLNKICQDASQVLFNNVKYTTTQCVNKWQNIFRLYKATKRYLNHTGGGDGDEDQGGDSTDTQTEDGTDGDKKTASKKKNGQQYSPATMISFSEGPLYPLILRVADGRADIDRPVEFSSHRKPEEIDGDMKKTGKKRKKSDASDLQEMLSETLQSVKTQREESALRDDERFAYEKRRDERKELQETEKMKLEREKMMIERLNAELHQKREVEDLRFAKLERYRAMRDSTDPLEQAFAKKLAEEIRAEQDL